MTDYWHWERAYGTTSVNVKEAFAELFNTDQFSNVDTLVRESVQNILDAELNSEKPVEVDFSFGESNDPFIGEFFSSLKEFRNNCPNVPYADFSSVKWLVIKDSNTTGLKGEINGRNNSNFWKYWMNFGSGSKVSGNLGRHGVGRVSIILGSKAHTIIGATLREGEHKPILSGISLLDCTNYDGKERSSTSLLVDDFLDQEDIYKLHGADKVDAILNAFGISFDGPGLALIVVSPRDEITPDRIKAAIIEHFASAIIKGTLKASCNGDEINKDNIVVTARSLSENFQIRNMKEDYESYLALIADLHDEDKSKFSVNFDYPKRIKDHDFSEDELLNFRETLSKNGKILFDFNFNLEVKNEEGSTVDQKCTFKVGFSHPSVPTKGVETYHRRGMAIPNGPFANDQRVGDGSYTAVITAADRELANLLNICEGKAHLHWSSSTHVCEELDKSYANGMKVRNMCALSLKDIYGILNESSSEPDQNFWQNFFSAPLEHDPSSDEDEDEDPYDDPDEPPEEPLEQRSHLYSHSQTKTGFVIEGNPDFDFEGQVLSFRVCVAYETEGKDPFAFWDADDFDLQAQHKMTNFQNCITSWRSGNEFDVTVNRPDFKLTVEGFDTNREVAVKIYRLR
jgi:hypothetical protein